MRTVAIIQARMGSTRLPGKVLRKLHGGTVLAHVVARVRRASRLDDIWIATTDQAQDDVIQEEAARLDINCYRGSEQDVLARYVETARAAKAEVIVRVTADCPLFDGQLLDRMLRYFDQPPLLDYLSNVHHRTFPRGLDAEIFTMSALEIAASAAGEPHQREHVTPYFYENPARFQLAECQRDEDWSTYRLTLDTPEDWTLLATIISKLAPTNPQFTTTDVIELLQAQPELMALNNHIKQKKLNSTGFFDETVS